MSTRNLPLSFGDFVKNHRMGEELTQVEFAKFLGISKQRLCDIEKNRTNISLKLCRKISKNLIFPLNGLLNYRFKIK